MMEITHNTQAMVRHRSAVSTSSEAERLLAEAGVDFTRVQRCPVVECEFCSRRDGLATAA